jgi:putative transposase
MRPSYDTKDLPKTLRQLLAAPPDMKVELINHCHEIMRLLGDEAIEEEVTEVAGERYAREPEKDRYHRWGYNPGSIRIGQERVPIKVPRVRDLEQDVEHPLESYRRLHEGVADDEEHLRDTILLGISTRDYERVAKKFADGFGLSQASVSRAFVARSRAALECFETRSLAEDDFVALWLDGKSMAAEQVVLCLGVRTDGVKRVLGFVECSTENCEAVTGLLRSLIERGLRYSEGLLFVIDGAKGIRKAISNVFGKYGVVQRCQWHKRENVVSYLPKSLQKEFRSRLQGAYQKTNYTEAKKALMALRSELEKINRSAARSLEEGLEETLTLHRLGIFAELGVHLKTTNAIENLNHRLEAYLGKVKHWVTSEQRHRWVALASLEIEPRLQRLTHSNRLPLLRQALRLEIGLDTEPPS